MNKIVVLLAAALIAAPALADDATPMTPAQDNSTAPAAAPMQSPAAQTPAPKPTGTVARSAFTTGIKDREPVDSITTLTNDHNKVYFFTELKDLAGETVTHRWEYNGKVMAEIPFKVGGNRWRVYSSKQLEPSWTGTWKVSVVDQSGATLAVKTFDYTKAPAMPAPASAPAAAPAAPATPAKPAPSNPCAPKM
jgi:hypothetical protein